MATFEEVSRLIQETYRRIWSDWYRGRSGLSPAQLTVSTADCSSGYRPRKDTIDVAIPEGNLRDSDVLAPGKWPVWMIDLIEEMLHEFQHKAVTEPTDAGIELCKSYCRSFADEGHDDRFFSAIAMNARYFKMAPEQLILTLTGQFRPNARPS